MKNKISQKYLNVLTYKIIGIAIEVHKELGPGLLESVYHQCMLHEMRMQKINFLSELTIPIEYKGLKLQADLRCDIFIEGLLVVELKSVEKVLPIHEAKLLTYMKLLGVPKGILINFNVINIFSEGQKTFVNEIFRSLPDN